MLNTSIPVVLLIFVLLAAFTSLLLWGSTHVMEHTRPAHMPELGVNLYLESVHHHIRGIVRGWEARIPRNHLLRESPLLECIDASPPRLPLRPRLLLDRELEQDSRG